MKKPKLCYVLPEFNETTHFVYLVDFIQSATEFFDIALLVERSGVPQKFVTSAPPGIAFYPQQLSLFPFRFLENLFLFFVLRVRGYRDFYVHYSFFSAYNASLVTRICGGRTFYWNCGLPWNYKKPYLRERFERNVYRKISYLVTGTESLKKEYALHYPISEDRIRVMPNWIDLHKWQVDNKKGISLRANLQIPENTKVILFVHRLSRRKGAHLLLDILKHLDDDVILLVVGDGPERQKLESLARDSQQEEKIRFLGWQPNEMIKAYFTIADVFIMPSEEEGLPHVLLEAMAMGVPYVAFLVGGVAEITPPLLRQFLHENGDGEAFARSVRVLLAPETDIKNIVAEEQHWIEQYSTPRVLKIFQNLFL